MPIGCETEAKVFFKFYYLLSLSTKSIAPASFAYLFLFPPYPPFHFYEFVFIWSLFETNYYLVEESDRFYFLHPELLVVISIQIIPDTQPIVKQNVFI